MAVTWGRCWSVRLLHFAAASSGMLLTLNRQWHNQSEMSDTGRTVPAMIDAPSRYDLTITVDTDGGGFPIRLSSLRQLSRRSISIPLQVMRDLAH